MKDLEIFGWKMIGAESCSMNSVTMKFSNGKTYQKIPMSYEKYVMIANMYNYIRIIHYNYIT